MLHLWILTLLAAVAPETRAVSFDEAKADASKRAAYLEQIVGKHVFDKEKNPTGTLKAWFFVADEKRKAAAEEAIKEKYKAEGREFYFAKEVKAIFAPLESSARRAVVWYPDNVIAGAGAKAGFLLVGDVFSLACEDEVKSVVEDFAFGYVKLRENNLKVKDLELDANIPALKLVSNRSLLPLFAQADQLEAVLKGTRKVSDGFKAELVKQYLATHSVFSRDFAKERKVYDDNNENTLQKEIVDFLDECFKFDHERFEKLGYQHKVVNKDQHEYALDKK